MDEIQTFSGQTPSPHAPRAVPSPLVANPAAVKTASNYLRAVRRRPWLVLAVSVPLAVLTCVFVLRMPNVYRAKAEIEINPPDFDSVLLTLVSHPIGGGNPAQREEYVPSHAARLKSSRLHEQVVTDPAVAPRVGGSEDAALELFKSLSVLPVYRNGGTYTVTLEGEDPALTKTLLEKLLLFFQSQAREENEKKLYATKDYAGRNLHTLEEDLKQLDRSIGQALSSNSSTFGPGGKSIIEEQYVSLANMLSHKQSRLDELSQQAMFADAFPKVDFSPEEHERQSRLAHLELQRRHGVRQLEHVKQVAVNFNNEPSALYWAEELDKVIDEMNELKAIGKKKRAVDPRKALVEQYGRELDADRAQQDELLKKMQETLPVHQKLLTMMEERRETYKGIDDMRRKLAEFDVLAHSLTETDFVVVPSSVPEPKIPVKPKRAIFIIAALLFSLGAGIGLVCLLEHLDHSIKVPEHASHGLTLPLLGVVPRIPRTALTQRGRHLWARGTPDSLASDAYRNVRASLLGVADRHGPIVTLLVTSAKAGEGKSTTALNLAATCALAGERTLLLDVDLRRPTLDGVFHEETADDDEETPAPAQARARGDDDGPAPAPGLVDVLRGEVPWQSTLRHTRIANLDFIPTGDTSGTPIEILGTLELRQLMTAFSHHYDRVILDGPAVLGLADCRFLGRIVDASLLVVRSGAHHLTTLHRAKAMLEQSRVVVAGVVFNGLFEDVRGWSSYGYGEGLPAPDRGASRARADGALALADQG